MTTKKNFANLMLVSIVAITTISLTSCKDDSIDDNKKVRDGWTLGTTVNAEYSIMNFLKSLA